MSNGVMEGTTIGCMRCGAVVVVFDLVSDATCPYCGHVQQLDPRWVEAAIWYGDSMQRQLDELLRAKQDADIARSSADPQELMIIGIALLFLLALGVGFCLVVVE